MPTNSTPSFSSSTTTRPFTIRAHAETPCCISMGMCARGESIQTFPLEHQHELLSAGVGWGWSPLGGFSPRKLVVRSWCQWHLCLLTGEVGFRFWPGLSNQQPAHTPQKTRIPALKFPFVPLTTSVFFPKLSSDCLRAFGGGLCPPYPRMGGYLVSPPLALWFSTSMFPECIA